MYRSYSNPSRTFFSIVNTTENMVRLRNEGGKIRWMRDSLRKKQSKQFRFGDNLGPYDKPASAA